MRLPNPLCWLRTAWRTLRTGPGAVVAGHSFIEEEVRDNCRVSVLRCETCGKVSVAWEARS